jgi:DMSO/TMAO reductase YedYZ molybdopterin-dependent catalytic subunit
MDSRRRDGQDGNPRRRYDAIEGDVMNRRKVVLGLTAGGAIAGLDALPGRALAAGGKPALDAALPAGVHASAYLEAPPGKQPLIKLTWRPPNYESPLDAFHDAITPNDRFFVRYHLAGIPEQADLARDWRLTVGGTGAASPFELTLEELQREFPVTEVTALCLCSGNRRGLFEPHVPGVQWGSGAMGNARWRGARLADVLNRAGVGDGVVEVAANGADRALLDATPDFVKSVPLAKALHPDTLIAYEMNGEPLPHLNGYPARLVVPGWTATYWIKHLTQLDLLTAPHDGFWMRKGYRVPKGAFPVREPFTSQEDDKTSPITEIVVNSLITSPVEGQRVAARRGIEVRGVAWDGGTGVRSVEVSMDGGATWRPALLGPDLGPYSLRTWSATVEKPARGAATVLARATAMDGSTQPERAVPNPAGYHHNALRPVAFTIT